MQLLTTVLESFEGFEDIREYPCNNTKGNLKVSEIRLALLHLSVIYEGHLHEVRFWVPTVQYPLVYRTHTHHLGGGCPRGDSQ